MAYFITDVPSRNKIKLAYTDQSELVLTLTDRFISVNAVNMAVLAQSAYVLDTATIDKRFRDAGPDDRRPLEFKNPSLLRSPFCVPIHSEGQIRKPADGSTQGIHFHSIPDTNTQFFFYQTGKEIVFSVRGTQQRPDWLFNAQFTMAPFGEAPGSVHEGFLACFQSVKPIVDDFLQENLGQKNVFVTGHSLGGAVATLLAAYIRKRWTPNVMLYTFGCPRVGDTEFVDYFTREMPLTCFRVVNGNDLFTMLPTPQTDHIWYMLTLGSQDPSLVPLSFYDHNGNPYEHLGTLVYIRGLPNGSAEVNVDFKSVPHERVWVRATADVRRTRDDFRSLRHFSVEDHNMERYLSILSSHMRDSIRAYLSAEDAPQNTSGVEARIQSEIEALRRREAEVHREMFSFYEPMLPDATSVAPLRPAEDRRKDELERLHCAIESRQEQLLMQQQYIRACKTPAFRNELLRMIVDLPYDDSIKEEFEFQVGKHP